MPYPPTCMHVLAFDEFKASVLNFTASGSLQSGNSMMLLVNDISGFNLQTLKSI